jgi:hypothetical protein
MSTVADPQTQLEERVLEGAVVGALEEALETREKRKASKQAVTKQYKEADDRVKALLGEFDLQDGEVARCGRFRIAKKGIPAKTVMFETEPSSRLFIGVDKDD